MTLLHLGKIMQSSILEGLYGSAPNKFLQEVSYIHDIWLQTNIIELANTKILINKGFQLFNHLPLCKNLTTFH